MKAHQHDTKEDIQKQLEIHKKRAEEKLKKRLDGDGLGGVDEAYKKKHKE